VDGGPSHTWQGLFQALPHGAVLLHEREATTQAQGQTLGERKTSGARQKLGMEARRGATKCDDEVMRARFN
jgi:hypothetical protein